MVYCENRIYSEMEVISAKDFSEIIENVRKTFKDVEIKFIERKEDNCKYTITYKYQISFYYNFNIVV